MTTGNTSRELNLSPELHTLARQTDLRQLVNRLAWELRPHGPALVQLAVGVVAAMRQGAGREGTAQELVKSLALALEVEPAAVDAMTREINR